MTPESGEALLRLSAAPLIDVPAETDMSGFDDALRDRVAHWYPTFPPYRRSGVSQGPQVGDVALCGYVKQYAPVGKAVAEKFPLCSGCEQLRLLGFGSRPR